MAKKANELSAKFALRGIELHELVVRKLPPGFVINNFHFGINIETNVDQSQKLVIATTTITINADDKTTEVGRVICACIFSVANFDEVIMRKSESHFELIQPFADTINSICLSTTRGFMASELKGTILHHAFLPIVDVKSLSKTPVQ